jgi:hypothetical protein
MRSTNLGGSHAGDCLSGMEGTSYIVPVKRENEKILSFIKTASYKTLLILGTLFLSNPMTDLPLTRRISRP